MPKKDNCGKDAVHWDVYEEPHPYDSNKVVVERFGCCGSSECHGPRTPKTIVVNSPGSALCGDFEVETVDKAVRT